MVTTNHPPADMTDPVACLDLAMPTNVYLHRLAAPRYHLLDAAIVIEITRQIQMVKTVFPEISPSIK